MNTLSETAVNHHLHQFLLNINTLIRYIFQSTIITDTSSYKQSYQILLPVMTIIRHFSL